MCEILGFIFKNLKSSGKAIRAIQINLNLFAITAALYAVTQERKIRWLREELEQLKRRAEGA